MNLVSALLGLSVMGIAAPTVLDMSIAPLIAQKRAINFGSAESAAVVFAAANQGATQVGNPPAGCQLDNGTNAPAREITCTHGRSKFAQTVSRSFITNYPSSAPNTGNNQQFPMSKPPGNIGWRDCPTTGQWADPWGNNFYNRDFVEPGYLCRPEPIQNGKLLGANPNMTGWLWDLRGLGFD